MYVIFEKVYYSVRYANNKSKLKLDEYVVNAWDKCFDSDVLIYYIFINVYNYGQVNLTNNHIIPLMIKCYILLR